MFLPKIDIFKDLRQEAVADLSEAAVQQTYEKGSVLFSAGDPAEKVFILVDGTVELVLGTEATSHYTVNKIGELFGWSSAVGRNCYSAGATCVSETTLISIDRESLEAVFDAHARSGRVFYRRLAEAMGERWLETHQAAMSLMELERDLSYGSGQVMAAGED